MQGSSRSLSVRLRVAGALAGGFLAGAITVFAVAFWLGQGLGLAALPVATRRGVAIGALLLLASLDVLALRRGTYCPVGWRRQTPRALMYRRGPAVVAAWWGLDTGLAVTTIRVAALTWGAMLLTLLGLAPWWLGIAYGLGFVLPVMALLWAPRLGRAAVSRKPTDPGLETLLQRRPWVQLASLVLLATGGTALLLELLG